jgi:dihydrodipicolinate synthase/N-acetylneuraminate lyase
MKTTPVTFHDLRGVLPVPPLCRRPDAARTLDFTETGRLAAHIVAGGPRALLYGGNAFLYHVTLAEYDALLDWLTTLPDDVWAIPSIGPSFGRAMDQAALLKRHRFPCVMALPCGDPRDAAGLERGLREVAEAAGTPLMLYLKEEQNFGADLAAGLDAVARLVDSGVAVAIKYAVVRADPREDAYLAALLARVERTRVVSGIGERPAIVHLEQWQLAGFTTGSGCIAPRLSQAIFDACAAGDFDAADALRARFLPLEDLRDARGPARVLHAAVEHAALARTGPIPPFVSELPADAHDELRAVAHALLAANSGAPQASPAPAPSGA